MSAGTDAYIAMGHGHHTVPDYEPQEVLKVLRRYWRATRMNVGVIKEIKDKEHRVALTPAGAKALHKAGHTVLVQAGAGLGSGFSEAQYCAAGAHIVTVEQAWDADLVLKVKEPLAAEYHYLQKQILFTYFHLAGVPQTLTATLLKQKTTAVA